MGTVRALPAFYSPIGFEKLTVSSTVVSFTLPSDVTTRAVVFSVENAQVRFRVDGNNPDSTTGVLLNPGDVVEITNVNMILNFKAIRAGTSDAVIQIHYFGGGV